MSLDPTRKHLRAAVAQQYAFHDGIKHGDEAAQIRTRGAARPSGPTLRKSKASRALANPYIETVERSKGSARVIEKQQKLATKAQRLSVPLASFKRDKKTLQQQEQAQMTKNLHLLLDRNDINTISAQNSLDWNATVHQAKVSKRRRKHVEKKLTKLGHKTTKFAPNASGWI